MYCYKCGNLIRDNAIFCSSCGTKITAISSQNNQTSVSKCNSEYDRNALKIYLKNILQLEYANRALQDKLNIINSNYNTLYNNNFYEKYLLMDDSTDNVCGKQYCHLFFDGEDYYIAINTICYPIQPVYDEQYLREGEYSWYKVDDYREQLNELLYWPCSTLSIIVRPKQATKRSRFFSKYEHFKSVAPSQYKKNRKLLQQYSDDYNKISTEQKKIVAMLQKAYDLNIIPIQFRKIEAIYFLNEYIQTSMETFSSALLHLDLDVIKSKLNNIIMNQQSSLLKMAVIESQNTELQRENQEILKSLSAIEHNTQLTTNYTKIAAINSETCAWFSAATFFQEYFH